MGKMPDLFSVQGSIAKMLDPGLGEELRGHNFSFPRLQLKYVRHDS